jgi:hypothetical protein
MSKQMQDFFQILWPSHNVVTLGTFNLFLEIIIAFDKWMIIW